MRMIYNGVDLMPIETHVMDTEAVYDDSGVDYLYSRFTASVRAMVSGQSMTVLPLTGTNVNSFINYAWMSSQSGDQTAIPRDTPTLVPPTTFTGTGPTTPPDKGIDYKTKSPLRTIAVVRNSPPLTHQVIRHRLSTPRGKLYVFSGPGVDLPAGITTTVPDPPGGRPTVTGNTSIGGRVQTSLNATDVLMMIEAPVDNAPCDCKNGPLPRLLGIHGVEGDAGVFVVDFSIEAYFNEADMNNVVPSGALLSNRFSQGHEVREDGFTTITTQGKAIFRTDRLYETMTNPDSNRPILFMPILQGFVRENINVVGLPDATGVVYSYRDRQVYVNFPAGPYVGAASISAIHRQAIVSNTQLGASLLKIPSDIIQTNRQLRREKLEDSELDSMEKELRRKNFINRANKVLKSRKP